MVVLVGAVLFMGYLARLRDLAEASEVIAAQLGQLHTALEGKAAQAAGLESTRMALRDAEQRLHHERWRLAAGEGMSELLDQLAISGHEHGLLFERLDVLGMQPQAGYHLIPLEISVVGRYPGLRTWLEEWLGQVRLLDVSHIELLAVDGQSGLARAKLQVNAHRPDEDLAPPASLAHQPARGPVSTSAFDPFQAWSSPVAAHGMGRIPLEQLEMVGSLSQAGHRQALLRSAGRLYRVGVGEALGRDEGVVVRVDAHQVEVRERLYINGGWQQRSRYLALGKGAYGGGRDEVEALVELLGDGPAEQRRRVNGGGV